MIGTLLHYFENLILFYFFALNTIYLSLLLASYYQIRQQLFLTNSIRNRQQLMRPDFTPGVTILIPAYNEAKTIVKNIYSLLMLNYPQLQIIVINDGSTDRTMHVLGEAFTLRSAQLKAEGQLPSARIRKTYTVAHKPQLLIIDKENSGKADSLNCGLNYTTNPYFCCFDADIILPPEALLKLLRPFLENPEEVIAVGGIVKIANDCLTRKGTIVQDQLPQKTLPALQVIEYIRSFLFGRLGFSLFNGLLIISGAFGAFATATVRTVGGYSPKTISEDMELIMRLHTYHRQHKKKYKILFIAEPVCWTEVPSTLKVLYKQRNRWQRGLCECLWQYKNLFCNPRYGSLGLVSMPYFVCFEFFGSILEVLGYAYVLVMFALQRLEPQFFFTLFALAILYGIFLSLASLLLEDLEFQWYTNPRALLRLASLAVIENFGYRQLLAFWRVKGILDFLFGKKGWGTMQRTGF